MRAVTTQKDQTKLVYESSEYIESNLNGGMWTVTTLDQSAMVGAQCR